MPAAVVPPVLVADGSDAGIPNTLLIDFQRPDPIGMAGVVQSTGGTIHGKQVWVGYGQARAALEYLSLRYQSGQFMVTDAADAVLRRMGIVGDVPGPQEVPPPEPVPEPPPDPGRTRGKRKRKRWRRVEDDLDPRELGRAEALRRLHLLPSAPPKVIKATYTALARTHHPDRGGDVEEMKAINEAWAILKK